MVFAQVFSKNIARKFKDSDAANGIVSLSDKIQFGHIGLIKAVDKIIWKTILDSKDPEKTIKSYFAKSFPTFKSISTYFFYYNIFF